jgi:hypothetical protein
MTDTTANNAKTEKDEDLKIFTIRCIPPDIHRKWKTVCFLEAVTMEQFAVEAIQEKLFKYFTEKPQKIRTEAEINAAARENQVNKD